MSGSGPAEEDGVVEAGAASAQDIYKEKPTSTMVRVLTVMAYLFSVSFAAILLSVYYICIWKSPEFPKSSNTGELVGFRRGGNNDYNSSATGNHAPYNYTGRSNTPVSDTATDSTLESFNFTKYNNEDSEPATNELEPENSTTQYDTKGNFSGDVNDLNTTNIT